MEKEFIPYDRALRMKALGFDEPCFAQFYKHPTQEKEEFRLFQDCAWENRTTSYWRTNISSHFVSAPTFSQAFRWFDYSTEWSGFIVPSKEEGCFEWWIQNYEDPNYLTIESDDWYGGREEAELACLDKLIEIVESKSK